MNITGKTVRLRDRIEADSSMETIWNLDRELSSLDVSAGKVTDTQRFSIETLDGRHIGTCSLYDWTEHDVQFGIRIGDKNYWNKGYGTEAVSILTDYCFSLGTIERVWLKVLPWNMRAIRCYVKCGFVSSGRLALNGYEFVIMEKKKG